MSDNIKILNIIDKIKNYKFFLLEYGYNEETDIFIKEGLKNLNEELESILKKIKNEK